MSDTSQPVSGLFSGPPLYVPQSPWSAVPAILITIAACASALLIGIVAVVAGMVSTGGELGSSEAAMEAFFSLASPTGIVTAIATQLGSLLVIWLAAGRAGMRRDVLQLAGAMPGWATILTGAVVLIAATSALEFLMYLTTKFDLAADTKWLREGLASPWWWGTVIIAVIFAPLWEEFAFRGFLLSALAKTSLGFWGGALVSNVMWTLLHWGYSWQGLASVFAAGIGLSWLIQRTGSIWAPIIAHGIANACALGFAVYLGS